MTYFRMGDHNAICDVCGFKYKFSQLLKNWQNLYVCKKCWEPRHPQDFVRAVKDRQSVPVSRPRNLTNFVAETSWNETTKQWE